MDRLYELVRATVFSLNGVVWGWPEALPAIVVLLGAGQYVCSRKDADAIQHRFCGRKDGCWVTDTGIGAKVGFWLLAVLSLPVTLTMVLSMLPLFGTHGQEMLFLLHRWSALFFALTAIVELYMLVRMEVIKDTENGVES